MYLTTRKHKISNYFSSVLNIEYCTNGDEIDEFNSVARVIRATLEEIRRQTRDYEPPTRSVAYPTHRRCVGFNVMMSEEVRIRNF